MTVVEFVGPPGAGKSRVLRNAIAKLPSGSALEPPAAARRWVETKGPSRVLRALLKTAPSDLGVKVTNRLLGRGFFAASALDRFRTQHTAFVETALALVEARRDVLPEADLFRTWIKNLCARYQLASEALDARSVFMLEEGFGTRGVGLFAFGWGAHDERDVIAYADAMPAPAVAVLVDTDVETCGRRLEERGWTRRTRHLSAQGKLAFLDGARSAARLIGDRLEARGADVVRVTSDSGDDETKSSAAVVDAVRRAQKDRNS